MGTFTNIIGYIVLGLSILFTLLWCLNVRSKVRNEQTTEKGMELQGFLMTVSVVLCLLLDFSPFHLLWMLPASFILGLLSMVTPLRILWIFSSLYFVLWYIGISNIGRKYYVTKQYDKAIEAFKEEIRQKPTSAEAYFNLGLAYGKIGQHEHEIGSYKKAIELNPNKPELYHNLGSVYSDIGNKGEAINALKEAIRIRPSYLKAHYFLCKIYSETGDLENALKEFEIVKKTDSKAAEELISFINLS